MERDRTKFIRVNDSISHAQYHRMVKKQLKRLFIGLLKRKGENVKHYKQDLNKIWQQWYGNKVIVKDISGREISLYEFNIDTERSWNIDHIMPISLGGTDVLENLIPMHIQTNIEKSDSFPMFNANNKIITIKRSFKNRNGKHKKGWCFYDDNKKII